MDFSRSPMPGAEQKLVDTSPTWQVAKEAGPSQGRPLPPVYGTATSGPLTRG